ncbi:MAG: DsbA family protein [Gammaproteobacteria bacterium]|nr:MAG: DsbA family protein [Gammaproteobacteria bacterium]
MTAILFYVHDPMCSWCWAFRPVWQEICERIPAEVETQRFLGGLAPDSDAPMPESMGAYLQQTWRTIQQRVPGTEFNFEFWSRCNPRRSTYPACRAVIAAGRQDSAKSEPMILAIQQAYYLDARNPSDTSTLVELAQEMGLDAQRFAADLDSEDVRRLHVDDLVRGEGYGVQGYPSLLLDMSGQVQHIPYDYTDPTPSLNAVRRALQDGTGR